MKYQDQSHKLNLPLTLRSIKYKITFNRNPNLKANLNVNPKFTHSIQNRKYKSSSKSKSTFQI